MILHIDSNLRIEYSKQFITPKKCFSCVRENKRQMRVILLVYPMKMDWNKQ